MFENNGMPLGKDMYDRQLHVGDFIVGAKRGGGRLVPGLLEKKNMETYTVFVDPQSNLAKYNKRMSVYFNPDSVLLLAKHDEVVYDDEGFYPGTVAKR